MLRVIRTPGSAVRLEDGSPLGSFRFLCWLSGLMGVALLSNTASRLGCLDNGPGGAGLAVTISHHQPRPSSRRSASLMDSADGSQ